MDILFPVHVGNIGNIGEQCKIAMFLCVIALWFDCVFVHRETAEYIYSLKDIERVEFLFPVDVDNLTKSRKIIVFLFVMA